MSYRNTCGRFKIDVSQTGTKNNDDSWGVTISTPNGWNDDVGHTETQLSVNELFDLKHLIDRALAECAPKNPG